MNESNNIWGIAEFEGDGISCPIVPTHLPWYKKATLTFFRFGVCPLCITMSLAYSVRKLVKKNVGEKASQPHIASEVLHTKTRQLISNDVRVYKPLVYDEVMD